MGPSQLLGGILCQKYGGKITFGYSNFVMALLTLLIPFVAELGIKSVILVRVLQGFAGVRKTTYLIINYHGSRVNWFITCNI